MKNKYSIIILFLACIMLGCTSKAIKIVKETKMFQTLDSDETIGEWVQRQVARESLTHYTWKARCYRGNLYVVSFRDPEGWGYSWEVNINDETVHFINSNAYLSFKHGFSKVDPTTPFPLCDITLDTLKHQKGKVIYQIKGSIQNNSGTTISYLDLDRSEINVIYKEKDFRSWNARAKFRRVSDDKPWKDKEKITFDLTTSIEDTYLDYPPEVVFFNVNVRASNPVGYDYDRIIYQKNITLSWGELAEKQ